ncbi:hypothetical protein [Oricola thermophila]|uniref:Uncharacterized protein n=1 Tax=Oricola thermophila TaxID=2742145 RepID=A0A6N1VEF1_9HYPH|nr:hypothetical protein [Oricola thermophila]QKV17985.1 hypothetical protein HTY61_05670 [Oricola thermophila]
MADTRQIDQERLEYVRAMLTELQRLVVADRHPTLSYLLEMAKLEVCDIVDGNDESGGGQE